MSVWGASRKLLQMYFYDTFIEPDIRDPLNVTSCWLAKPDPNNNVWKYTQTDEEIKTTNSKTTHTNKGEILCCGTLIDYRPTGMLPGPETSGLGWNLCKFGNATDRHGYTVSSCQKYELEQKDPRPATWHFVGAPFKSGVSEQYEIFFVEYDKQAKRPMLSSMITTESLTYTLQPKNDSAMHFWLAKPKQSDNFPASWLTNGYALIGGKLIDMKPVDHLPPPNTYFRDDSIEEHEGQEIGNLCFFALDSSIEGMRDRWRREFRRYRIADLFVEGICREVRKGEIQFSGP
ncbi:hypothetical protein BCR37DRAFT_104537 [Protomyces lactucae-debilis]|uniref:Uncharacterized protein n=1 Tax=Protomyces lactucae-debilis TaxID=2754530 RepID=A0A1Y2F3N5_PROLT|nr:uncharacterized protein BCR37DRAFT_104537 [Protomyces lactucae-debilis]ORY78491.1 hypothetical protein BCR37DRAFT_104537 [Protomyces lactucae-debilis]